MMLLVYNSSKHHKQRKISECLERVGMGDDDAKDVDNAGDGDTHFPLRRNNRRTHQEHKNTHYNTHTFVQYAYHTSQHKYFGD